MAEEGFVVVVVVYKYKLSLLSTSSTNFYIWTLYIYIYIHAIAPCGQFRLVFWGKPAATLQHYPILFQVNALLAYHDFSQFMLQQLRGEIANSSSIFNCRWIFYIQDNKHTGPIFLGRWCKGPEQKRNTA